MIRRSRSFTSWAGTLEKALGVGLGCCRVAVRFFLLSRYHVLRRARDGDGIALLKRWRASVIIDDRPMVIGEDRVV